MQIRQVAEARLDRTKNHIQPSSPGGACHYLVLESFDILGGSLDKFLSTYYQGASYAHLLLRGDEIGQITAAVKALKNDLTLGQVLELIPYLQAQSTDLVAKQVKRMLELVPKSKRDQVQQTIENLVGDRPERWYILADLWNYATE